MRIAFAEIAQETDSFSPLIADRRDFEAYGLYFGESMLSHVRGVGPLGGFLDVVAEQPAPVELIPLVRAWGSAGGKIASETIDEFLSEFVSRLRQAPPLDALFLSLHGAASSVDCDDVEGLVLRTAREVLGERVPIAVALDHHANITSEMVRHAQWLVGHETQPHDPPATGRKIARLLFRQLRGEVTPALRWRKIPFITPQDQFLTSSGPMQEWFDLARQFESRPGVLDVSPYPMQPWLDVAEGGWAVTVHTNGDAQLADAVAHEMAEAAWQRRAAFWRSERVAPHDAIRQANAAHEGLVILSDTGDSVYGGAPGDSTCLLRAMLDVPPTGIALVPIVDPVAVAAAHAAGAGQPITLEVGAKFDQQFSQPVRIEGRVAALSRGVAVDLLDRGICDMGHTALIAIGNIRLVLLDHRSFAINHPVLYTHLGIDLNDVRMVVLKTASNFQFFQRWRKALVRVDSPGTTQSDLTTLPWRRLPRPIYPLDPLDRLP